MWEEAVKKSRKKGGEELIPDQCACFRCCHYIIAPKGSTLAEMAR